MSARARERLTFERLAECVRRLDPGTRALLDLSVRRGVGDDTMAPQLHTDPFHLAWRRARALEALARALADDGEEPPPLGDVRAALQDLPDGVWLVGLGPPALPAGGTESGAELVVAADARPGVVARLDAYAAASPTLREAFGQVRRALARKAVRMVIWRRAA